MEIKKEASIKVRNLIFYNPRNDDLLSNFASTDLRAKKFLRNETSNLKNVRTGIEPFLSLRESKLNESSQTANFDSTTAFRDPFEFSSEHKESSLNDKSNTQKSTNSNLRALEPIKSYKDLEKTNTTPTLERFSSSDLIESMMTKESRKELNKAYRIAHEFKNLDFRRERERPRFTRENERIKLALDKLTEDKLSVTANNIATVRNDISHIFNKKHSKSPQSKQTLPELKEQFKQRFSKLILDINDDDKLSPQKNTGFSTNKQTSKLLDTTLRSGRFFKPEVSPPTKHQAFLSLHKDIRSVNTPNVLIKRGVQPPTRERPQNNETTQSQIFIKGPVTEFELSEDSNIMRNLKTELPNAFSSNPSNRQEVLALGNWLINTIKSVQEDNTLSLKEKYYKTDEIYNLCFNELVRQVSLDCLERGELIMKIWKAYLSLSQDIIEDVKETEKRIKTKVIIEWESARYNFEQVSKEKEKEIQSIKEELEIKGKEILEQDSRIGRFNEEQAKVTKENLQIKESLKKLQKLYNALKIEHRDLSFKYDKLKKRFDETDHKDSQKESMQDLNIVPGTANYIDSLVSDETMKMAPVFGNVTQKVIKKEDKEISMTSLLELQEKERALLRNEEGTQTDLALINKRFDPILRSASALDDILREEAAKARLVKEGELIENMRNRKKSSKASRLKTSISVHEDEFAVRNPESRSKGETFIINEIASGNDGIFGTLKSPIQKINGSNQHTPRSSEFRYQIHIYEEEEISPQNLHSPNSQTKKVHLKQTARNRNSFRNSQEVENSPKTKSDQVPQEQEDDISESFDSNDSFASENIKVDTEFSYNDSILHSETQLTPTEARNLNDKRTKVRKSKFAGKDELPSNIQNLTQNEVLETKKINEELEERKESGKSKRKRKILEDSPSINSEAKIAQPGQIEKGSETGKGINLMISPETLSIESFNKAEMVSEGTRVFKENLNVETEEDIYEETVPTESPSKRERPRNVSVGAKKLTNQINGIKKNANSLYSPKALRSRARTLEFKDPLKNQLASDSNKQQKRNPRGSILVENDKKKQISKSPSLQPSKQSPNIKNTNINLSSSLVMQNISPPSESPNYKTGTSSSDKERLPIRKDASTKTMIPKLAESDKFENKPHMLQEITETYEQLDFENEESSPWAENQEERISTFMNMYKIEKKKQEELLSINLELEKQISQDGILIGSFQELIREMSQKSDLSPTQKEKLEHLSRSVIKRKSNMTVIEELKPKIKTFTRLSTLQLSNKNPESPKRRGFEDFGSNVFRLPPTSQYKGDFNSDLALSLSQKYFIMERANNVGQNTISRIRKDLYLGKIKLKSSLPLKSILKQLTAFYYEKIHQGKENPMLKEQDLGTFVHKQFINTYGFQKFGINKLAKFIVNVRYYHSVHRVRNFAKIMNILGPEENFTLQESKQYLNGMEFLLYCTIPGVHYINSDSKNHYVPFVRALEYVKIFSDKYAEKSQDEILEFKKELERFRTPDQNKNNPMGLIDMDVFLENIVYQYRLLINKVKDALLMAFSAADLLKEDKVKFGGFMSLYKAIEGEKGEDKKWEEIFISYCDLIGEENVALSKEQFVAMCFETNIFSEQKFNDYFEVSNDEEFERKFDEFVEKWEEKFKETSEIIENKQPSFAHHICMRWKIILKGIEDDIQKTEISEKKALLIRYKILRYDLEQNTIIN